MNDLSLPTRRAGPADLPRIALLERACFSEGTGVFSHRQLRDLLHNPNAYWLLGAEGQAMACWLRADNGHARWARLYSVAVHPHRRGQGWAGRLLEAGFDWMRQNGLPVCRAEVTIDNQPARRLYADFGFQEAALLPDYYGPGLAGVRLIKRVVAPLIRPQAAYNRTSIAGPAIAK
jgi:ribosomal protein S18 acetylase RimI-like enzyme